MKRIVFLIFLFTLLLAGGKSMRANAHKITIDSETNWDTFIKEKVKFNKLNRPNILIKFSEFDLEEDYLTNNDFKSNNLPLVKSLSLDKWYLINNESLKDAVYCNILYNCEPNYGQSTPIYLFHSVLRI